MLGRYLDALTIGHKSCNMLSTLNKLTMQKELQSFVTNNVFWTQSTTTTTTTTKNNKESNIKTLVGAGD